MSGCEARCTHGQQCESEEPGVTGQHWAWTDNGKDLHLHLWTASKPCDQEEQ